MNPRLSFNTVDRRNGNRKKADFGGESQPRANPIATNDRWCFCPLPGRVATGLSPSLKASKKMPQTKKDEQYQHGRAGPKRQGNRACPGPVHRYDARDGF